jgi:2-polyprenyl-3-methyl-5-hydroxy-6-metoxy-1,4-benzoquinol methylase
VIDYVDRQAPLGRVLDFGCGSGVMLPFLAKVSGHAVAADVDLVPLEHMRQHIPLASNVQILDASSSAVSSEPPASFDLIIAVNVLEHVRDLPDTVDQLLRLVRQGPELVLSGPTESMLCRFGRRLAGPEYSGEYHGRGAAEIRNSLAAKVNLRQIATLYWPAPLFEIFSAVA